MPRTTWGLVWRGLLLISLALGVDAFWLEPSSIRVAEHRVKLGNRSSALRGLRIVIIADLHAGAPYIDGGKIRQVVKLALAARPDLVLLAGDYVTQAQFGYGEMPIETIAALLEPLHAPLGVFAILGNHDHIVVPSKFGQRYASGEVRENGKILFVSTGIGTSILPVRFRVPPEISLVEIH